MKSISVNSIIKKVSICKLVKLLHIRNLSLAIKFNYFFDSHVLSFYFNVLAINPWPISVLKMLKFTRLKFSLAAFKWLTQHSAYQTGLPSRPDYRRTSSWISAILRKQSVTWINYFHSYAFRSAFRRVIYYHTSYKMWFCRKRLQNYFLMFRVSVMAAGLYQAHIFALIKQIGTLLSD